MPYQYIHTSAKRGLEPGQSGFCCVARDADIPPDLIRELERISQYDHLPSGARPIIRRYLEVKTRKSAYHVLSLIQDAGVDYSKRNNHIAHHLAFTPAEVEFLPDPATLLLCWTQWLPRWTKPPRLLDENDRFDIKDLNTSRIENLVPPDFPTLLNAEGPHRLIFNADAGDEEISTFHFRNTLQHLRDAEHWRYPFTSHLQSNDNPSQFVWAAAQRDRTLPYDLDLAPRPLNPPAAEPETEEYPDSEYSEEKEIKQDTSFIKTAPKVEIPQDFDRRKLKKPKAKWTSRRISILINVSLVCMALITIGLLARFVFPEPEPEPEIKTPADAADTTVPLETAHTEWTRLAQSGQLLDQFDHAQDTARMLDQLGQPEPFYILELIRSLNETYTQAPARTASLATIRPALMETGSITASFHPDTSQLPELQQFSDKILLCPDYLVGPLQELQQLGASASMIHQALSPREYDGSRIALSLRECRRVNRDRFSNQIPTKDQAIINFFELKQSILADRRLKSLLAIQDVFGAGPSGAYIAFGPDGMLQNTDTLAYTDFLQQTFEGFILPKFTRFEATSAYREALKQSSKRDFPSPLDAAVSIYETLQIANPLEPQLKVAWGKIEKEWEDTFIREDLMEETLLSFAIEKLESHRQELIRYQSHFTKQELANYRIYKNIARILNDAQKKVSETSLKNQTWHFIRK